MTIAIDRAAAARVGVTASAVDEALYNAFGQRIISTIFTQTNQYRVILEATPGLLTSADSLTRFYVPSSGGAPVPLGTFATISQVQSPLAVNRVAQFPAATIGFDLAPGVSLGAGVTAINAEEARAGLPASISTTFLGAADAYRAALGNQLWLILAAVVCVYIVLGVLYESWVHPITILSTLPSAGLGALLGLWLTGNDLGVIGIIGLVLLIGIVKKNAIMMIDFALDAERNQGDGPGGRDPPGGGAALPADPDDHDGSDFRRAAADARLGLGIGAQKPAWHRDRRRADRQPAADPVHDAGDLSRLRPAGRAAEAGAGVTRFALTTVIPAQAGTHDLGRLRSWVPAYAGMTGRVA